MIEFNPNNKINKVNFTANLKGEEIVKPVENFLSEMIEHVTKSITDSRISSSLKNWKIILMPIRKFQSSGLESGQKKVPLILI